MGSGFIDFAWVDPLVNEAIDVFGEGIEMHRPVEGDYLAIVNAAGYGSSMSSNHCMRGEFSEYILLPDG